MSAVFGQIILTGITMGLIYIMVALGLTLVFGVMRVVNFVHGEMVMLAAFSMYYIYGVWHVNFVLALVVSAALVSAAGVFFQRYLYKPLKYDMDSVMICALGASYAIKSASWLAFGPVPRHIPTVFPGMLHFFGAYLSKERAAACVICIALTAGLYLVLHKTKMGKAIRAVEQDSEAAQVLGISIDGVNAMVFVIGCSLAAVAERLGSARRWRAAQASTRPGRVRQAMVLAASGKRNRRVPRVWDSRLRPVHTARTPSGGGAWLLMGSPMAAATSLAGRVAIWSPAP